MAILLSVFIVFASGALAQPVTYDIEWTNVSGGTPAWATGTVTFNTLNPSCYGPCSDIDSFNLSLGSDSFSKSDFYEFFAFFSGALDPNSSDNLATNGKLFDFNVFSSASGPDGSSANTFQYNGQFYQIINFRVGTPTTPLTLALSEASVSVTTGQAITPVTANASGGDGSYSYAVSPALPSGLVLDAATGAISGTPDTAVAGATYTVTVTDGTSATADATVQIAVAWPVTVTIDPFVLSGGTFTAAISLSENSSDFDAADLTLTNATATLTGSGSHYTATLTPDGDGEVRLSVAADMFTGASGNANEASNVVTGIYDGTPPTVIISGAPARLVAGSSFSLTVTFSEPVTGFTTAGMTTTNAAVIGLSGSGTTYTAVLKASGSGDVTVFVPANVAIDAANNGNSAPNLLEIADLTVDRTQELIATYMQTRANQLVRNQPNLIPFLSGTARGIFSANATRARGSFDFATGAEYPVWAQANGSWTTDGDSNSKYVFAALGGHHAITENLLVGAMLQFDHLSEKNGAATVSGTGWMVGPYFVAKSANHPLYFEGRLLYGETSNEISPFGTYEDRFDTERLLAQLKVAGELSFGTTTLVPFLDASYTTDDQKSYVDSLGNTISGQGIELGQIEIGMDFSKAISVSSGTLDLWGGISGIWSHTSGSGFASTVTPDYAGGRARIELGFNRALSANQNVTASAYYDGVGARGYESYGLSFGYEMQF